MTLRPATFQDLLDEHQSASNAYAIVHAKLQNVGVEMQEAFERVQNAERALIEFQAGEQI
jgi:hypothetical protein